MNDFYVYMIFRPDGRPCYVGKGRGDRMHRHERRGQNRHLKNIADNAGGHLSKMKVADGMGQAEAFVLERQLIAFHGRECDGGPLVNLTVGGEGSAGHKMPPEWCAHRSKMAKVVWADPEYKAKKSAAMAGNQNWKNRGPQSEAARESRRAAMLGNQRTKGMRHSEESKEKVRALWSDPEYKARIIAARVASGQYSPERVQARWAKRRANAAGITP